MITAASSHSRITNSISQTKYQISQCHIDLHYDIYTPTMMISLFHQVLKIHTYILIELKPNFLKILLIVLFQSCLAFFRLYKLFKILQIRLFPLIRHLCGILIKIKYLFLPTRLFKYTPVTSINISIIFSIIAIAKNILTNLHLTVHIKILVQFIS